MVYDADESLTLIYVIDESEVSFIEHSIRSIYLQVSFFGCGVIVGWSMVLISHLLRVLYGSLYMSRSSCLWGSVMQGARRDRTTLALAA